MINTDQSEKGINDDVSFYFPLVSPKDYEPSHEFSSESCKAPYQNDISYVYILCKTAIMGWKDFTLVTFQ